MDEIDFERAERLARAEIESGINAVRNEQRPPVDWDKETCTSCGDFVERGRLVMGCHRCLDCQRAHELRMKLQGRQ